MGPTFLGSDPRWDAPRPTEKVSITVIQKRLSDKVANLEFSKRDGVFLIIPYRPRKDTDQDEDTKRGRLDIDTLRTSASTAFKST